MWEWLWRGDGTNFMWIVLAVFGIRFLIKDVPELYFLLRKTPKHGDDDPSGNDNIKPRKPHDYL